MLRAFDPWLTARLRSERETYRLLAGRLRRGGSIAVVGAWPQGQAVVSALLALAVARFHGPGVLAVDASGDGGLHRRLAGRPAGSTDAVLVGLGIRAAAEGQPPAAPARRWLRQRLAIADEMMLLAGAVGGAEPRLRGDEYGAVLRALTRYVTLFITHAPLPDTADIVASAVRSADRVVLVGPDRDQDRARLLEWLSWIESVRSRPAGPSVVAAMLSPPGGRDTRRKPVELGVPTVVLPAGDLVSGSGPIRLCDLSPGVRRAALTLAGLAINGLMADKRG
jgi:hypothetical protein